MCALVKVRVCVPMCARARARARACARARARARACYSRTSNYQVEWDTFSLIIQSATM